MTMATLSLTPVPLRDARVKRPPELSLSGRGLYGALLIQHYTQGDEEGWRGVAWRGRGRRGGAGWAAPTGGEHYCEKKQMTGRFGADPSLHSRPPLINRFSTNMLCLTAPCPACEGEGAAWSGGLVSGVMAEQGHSLESNTFTCFTS